MRSFKLLRPLQCILAAWLMTLSFLSSRAETLSVFAAASLSESMNHLASTYEKQTGVKIALNLGASSLLARQIEEGAPVDLFFSADEAKMEVLERRGLLLPGSRLTLLTNSLVVVIPTNSPLQIHSAKDLVQSPLKRLALAEPKSVPAGIYAKQYLEAQGIWGTLESRVIPTENVRAALAAVESGNADAGIVYKTDAPIAKRIRVALEIPLSEGPKIQYPVAIIKSSTHPESARQFLQFLQTTNSTDAFRKQGFIVRRQP